MAKVYAVWRYDKDTEVRFYELINIFREKKDAWLYVKGKKDRDRGEYKYYYIECELEPN